MPGMSETPLSADEELVRFLAAPVPRPLPEALGKAALKANASLGGVMLGIFLFLFGSVFVYAFFPWRLADEWRLAGAGAQEVAGRIVSVKSARMTINGQQVMRYGFEFVDAQGGSVNGECFTSGRVWSPGAEVLVRYLPTKPALSCPLGARLSKGSRGLAFMVLFPLAGLGVAAWRMHARKRTRWVMQNGTLGDFRVTTIKATGVEINKLPQFKITLQRLDQADAEPHEVRWYKPELLAFARERLASGQAVFGLFDPAKPKKVLLPEAWSARV